MLNSYPMQKDSELNRYCVKNFLNAYDINPEYALKFYNMKRYDGILLRELDLYSTSIDKLFYTYGFNLKKQRYMYQKDSQAKLKDKCEFLQQLIDLKAPTGSYLFEKAEDAIYIMSLPFDFPEKNNRRQIAKKRIIEILEMKNQDNTLRFPMKRDSYGLEQGLKFLVEKPEIAQKYIDLKDEKGNPRFGLLDIAFIGQSYGYPPEDANWFSATGDTKALDILLSLKRNDGSYIYDSVPHRYDVELYKEYPEEFIKLANQKDDEGKYIESKYLEYYKNTLETIKKYPEEYQKFIETYPHYSKANIAPDSLKIINNKIDKIKPLLEKKIALRDIIQETWIFV